MEELPPHQSAFGRQLTTVGPFRLPGAVRARQPGPCLESVSLFLPLAALRRFPPQGEA